MSDWKILPIEKDENGNKIKVRIIYKGLELSYIPIISIKDGMEEKNIRESSRAYLYGGEHTPQKMKINNSVEQEIRKQVWVIFFKENKNVVVKKYFIPNEDKLIEEAFFFHSEVIAIKNTLRKKNFTELVRILNISRAEAISLTPQNYNYFSYEQKKILFDLNKIGLLLSKEGWIIVRRREGDREIRSVVFDIDDAFRMQDNILDTYIKDANTLLGEIPKIRELMELTRKINNLLIDWENTKKNKPSLKAKINVLINELSGYRNKYKTESKEVLNSFAGLTDSRGQENPSAFAAKTVRVLNLLEDRVSQIRDITPVIEKRKKIIKDSKDFLKTEKMRAEKELIELLKTRNFSYYSANGTNEIIINKIIRTLDCLTIEPFASQKMQATFYLQVAKSHILKARKAKKYLREALAILQS